MEKWVFLYACSLATVALNRVLVISGRLPSTLAGGTLRTLNNLDLF